MQRTRNMQPLPAVPANADTILGACGSPELAQIAVLRYNLKIIYSSPHWSNRMVAAYVQALRGSHRNVGLLLANSALIGLTVDGGIYSVIFNLYLLRLNFGPEFVGQVNSAANLVFAFASLAGGWLGARFGARRIMIVGLGAMIAGSSAVPLADTIPAAWQAPWVMASLVLLYAGMSLYYVSGALYLLQATRIAHRGNVFALQSAFAYIASFAGGLLGGLIPAIAAGLLGLTLLQPGPYRVPLMLVSGILVAALFVMLQTRDAEEDQPVSVPSAPGGAPPLVVTAYGLIAFMAAARFLMMAGIGAGLTFFNVYMDESLQVATAQIGLIAASARLVAVPAVLIGPSLSRRFGFGTTAVLAAGIAGLSLIPLALVPQVGVAGLGFIGLVSATSMRYPAFYVYLMERTPSRLRSIMNGVNEMAAGLSFSLMALAGGYIIVNYGYSAAFLVGATLTLFGTAVLAVYVRIYGEHAVDS